LVESDDTCKITFKKQLLPRFCKPGSKKSFFGRLLFSLWFNSSQEGKALSFRFQDLGSFIRANTKPATPKTAASPDAETQFVFM
jgi:hypothetical protein